MAKILFVSDNHGDDQILAAIATRFENRVDAMLHCGDSNLEDDDPALNGYEVVIGNTDWGQDFPLMINEDVNGTHVLMTHGHRFSVNSTLTPLLLKGQEANADVVAFGHTHQLGVTVEKGILFINPGSISQPRGEYASLGGTFAVVDATTSAFDVQYYDRDCQPVTKLHFHFDR